MSISFGIYQDDTRDRNLVIIYIFVLVFGLVSDIYFICYLIYGSILSHKYVKAMMKVRTGHIHLRRVRFTQRLLIGQAILTVITIFFQGYSIIYEDPFSSYYQQSAIVFCYLLSSVLQSFIIFGKWNLFQKPRKESGNSSSRMNTDASVKAETDEYRTKDTDSTDHTKRDFSMTTSENVDKKENLKETPKPIQQESSSSKEKSPSSTSRSSA